MRSIDITHSSDTDQRIDKFIKKYLPEAPLGGIYKWLRTGKIKVNRKKVDQTYRVELGDTIDIHLREDEIESFLAKSPIPKNHTGQNPQLEILYEDATFMIINKPAGLNVHP